MLGKKKFGAEIFGVSNEHQVYQELLLSKVTFLTILDDFYTLP